MSKLLVLSISDFKLVFRDPSLRIFWFMPFLIILLLNGLLPNVLVNYPIADKYLPMVIMGASLQTATMFGFIYCMVFIDEKDTGVARMYGVLPVNKSTFVLFRILLPFIISVIFTLIILMAQPFFAISFIPASLISLLAGCLAPIFALLVSNLSKNKMQGMTWYKIINLIFMVPLLAYFIPENISFILGAIPSYWIFKAIERLLNGEPYILFVIVGFLFCFSLLVYLSRKFSKIHFV